MKGDTKVIEYLNQGLRHELTAVNQFWLRYRLFDNWGYNELAKTWRKESSRRWSTRIGSPIASCSWRGSRICRT